MGQLKTIDDFERIAKAFADSESEQWHYRVRSFGYCTECRKMVEYESNYNIDTCYEKCLSCGREIKEPMTSFDLSKRFLLTDDEIPFSMKEEIDQLHSREKQQEYFRNLIFKHLKDLKIERGRKDEESYKLTVFIDYLGSLIKFEAS